MHEPTSDQMAEVAAEEVVQLHRRDVDALTDAESEVR